TAGPASASPRATGWRCAAPPRGRIAPPAAWSTRRRPTSGASGTVRWWSSTNSTTPRRSSTPRDEGVSAVRSGAEYRDGLRDGRRVWIIGEGLVEDVTLHPATRPMVEEYVAWYARPRAREWQDVVLAPPDARGARAPWAFATPRSAADLRAMGRSYAATSFLSAGNITHTPGYGNLIALHIRDVVLQRNVPSEQLAYATAYRERLIAEGRFLTFCAGAATIGYRLRQDPDQRAALRIVRETDAGLALSGKGCTPPDAGYS